LKKQCGLDIFTKTKKADEFLRPLDTVVIRRCWAMPNSNTFAIKPIGELISRRKFGMVIDPFANSNKHADITNDIDQQYDTDYHLDALEFLRTFENASVDTVLFDPPYSPRQVSEVYKNLVER